MKEYSSFDKKTSRFGSAVIVIIRFWFTRLWLHGIEDGLCFCSDDIDCQTTTQDGHDAARKSQETKDGKAFIPLGFTHACLHNKSIKKHRLDASDLCILCKDVTRRQLCRGHGKRDTARMIALAHLQGGVIQLRNFQVAQAGWAYEEQSKLIFRIASATSEEKSPGPGKVQRFLRVSGLEVKNKRKRMHQHSDLQQKVPLEVNCHDVRSLSQSQGRGKMNNGNRYLGRVVHDKVVRVGRDFCFMALC